MPEAPVFSARNPTRFLTTARRRVTVTLAQLELLVPTFHDAIPIATLMPFLHSLIKDALIQGIS